MFQCLGLGTIENGGCGEDWWHPGCVVGLGPKWYEKSDQTASKPKGPLPAIKEDAEDSTDPPAQDEKTNDQSKPTEPPNAEPPAESGEEAENEEEDVPLPPGFPDEDSFEGFICYKCVEANPWIKRYAGTPGFLPAVFKRSPSPSPEADLLQKTEASINRKKRKADEEAEAEEPDSKKLKEEPEATTLPTDPAPPTTTTTAATNNEEEKPCKLPNFPPAPTGQLSLFFKSDFREHFCRCRSCFPSLSTHPYLLEEEETYEHPVSESGDGDGGSTAGSGSIYERGESALKNVDRVRAIEGVMAYNHLKDKLKPFFQQFAESGQAISAEDIKAYFAKMRGDEEAIKEAAEGAKGAEQ